MKILYLEFIYLMLFPSFVLLYLVVTNKSEVERLFSKEVFEKIKIDRGIDKKTKTVFLFLALFLMIFALSRPLIEKEKIKVVDKKSPIVIALDVSKSMLNDKNSNRLIFAIKKIKEFIKKSKNLTISLILFSNRAYLVSPLTSDKETILFLLDNLDIKTLPMKEANFLSALKAADSLMSGFKEKNLLLFTNGGDKKDFSKEIEFAKKSGLRVYVVGLKKTRLNENIKKLAINTNGKFIKKDDDFFIKSQQGDKEVTITTELYPYILLVAFFFMFITFFSFPSKKAYSILFLMIFLSINTKAGILDFQDIKRAKESYKAGDFQKAVEYFEKVAKSKKNAQSFYDLANAYYKAKKYKKAIKYYNLVETPNKRLKFYTLYNLGNSYFMLKNYKKAVELYKKALKIKEDEDAKYNLNLALKRVKNQKEEVKKEKVILQKRKRKPDIKEVKDTPSTFIFPM